MLDDWYLCLYGSNSYSSEVTLIDKGTIQPLPIWDKSKSWFIPVEEPLQKNCPIPGVRLMYFNKDIYSYEDYLDNYGY